jgi:glucose/arabinose dehydrogenase
MSIRRAMFLHVPLAVALIFGLASCRTTPPPEGGAFVDKVVISGLTNPTSVRFASDGRVFVGEKSGLIKVYTNLLDTTPTIFADLRTDVHNYWDRGLLDIELDPGFPQNPYVYALYTRDAPIGGTSPTWGTAGKTSDPCPNPPGGDTDGCVVSGRLVRMQASGDHIVGSPTVLIDDWCMPSPTHSIGSLAFGPDGALYVSGGDGAFFSTWLDYGQTGNPVKNPCGDPPAGVGGTETIPTSEGGSLRAQDLQTPNDPVSLDGTIIRIDPATGAGMPNNPMASSPDPNKRRIIAYGFRNPFRIAFRTGAPSPGDLWVGDVGWQTWEEIDHLRSLTDSTVDDFGWPCYEGVDKQPSWDAANLNLCENLYANGPGPNTGLWSPAYQYEHHQDIVTGDGCLHGGSITGLAFASPSSIAYPAKYQGALFFADYSRLCIWWAPPDANGRPDLGQRKLFMPNAKTPVQLRIGPGGDLFYVAIEEGEIHRIVYQEAPQAIIKTTTPPYGALPLTVKFDGTGSTDANGLPLTYAWDLDGDGQFDDSTSPTPSWTYTTSADVTVRLQVKNSNNSVGVATTKITAGDTPPTPTIYAPPAGTTWNVGDTINFFGFASDAEQTMKASDLTWKLALNHCPSSCHVHNLQSWSGVASGSFTTPDHDYPSHLTLTLTAKDARGLTGTTSLELDPNVVTLQVGSDPAALTVSAGDLTGPSPQSRTMIQGGIATVSAPSPQQLDGVTYLFDHWSDFGAQSHDVTVDADTTLTATFTAAP